MRHFVRDRTILPSTSETGDSSLPVAVTDDLQVPDKSH
jgi:hypothetical protein